MEYKLGKANLVADTLSRKSELALITTPNFVLVDRIKEGLVGLTKRRKTRQFWLQDGVLTTKGKRVYVPKWQGLRKEIIKECHDSKWLGHPGIRRMMTLVELAYFGPR